MFSLCGTCAFVASQLLLIIVVKYQTCFIHAPARAQLREFLVSFVFPGDLATQMLFRDHVQTVVHARIRHFRDSVGRTLRQHQPATRRRCGIGANLPSSCPSGVEVVSMTPNLRRDQHSETEGHYAGTATLRSVSSPECYFCPSTLLQDGEERRQAKVEDEQRGTEMDYSAGPRTAARKAGSPGTDPDSTSEKERRRMDISHGVNSDFSEDTCRVVVPLWDDPNGAEQEEDRRKGYQVPSEQERRALTLTGRSQSRERSQPTPAQLTDGFHGSGRRARRNSGRPGPDQLFQQLQRVVQLARENGGAKGLESIWHQQPAQVEALLRLAEDVDETVGPKNNTDDRCQGAADPETHTSVGKVGRGEFGTRLPGVGERVGEASDDGPTRSRTKRRRGEEDCGEELEECNLARVSRDSDLSARSSSSCWRGETGRVANSDASRLVKGECAADLPGNSRVSRQTRSSGGNAEPEGQTRGEATLSSRRSWRAQASDVKDDEQPGNTHAETETAQTNRWTPQGQSWERLESKNPLRRKAAPNAECREKPHSGVGEVQTELSNSRGEFMSCGSDNGTSDCTRRATRQRGPGCDDKDPADLPPYLPTSDEATPAARSVVSGGTTTSSSTRHAAGVEDKKERTVSSTDDLPRSVLTEFLLTYCADSSKPTATTSDACKQTVKNPRVTGGKRSHRGVENSIETPAETS
ncbi:hypothetical protein CSUI_008156 [Cystoisospora suis]|uniref:Uncharacterized protein n=1 Tax=Cystoisospora suis TaxID=483139 RepID=A0A2C6KKD5_9APIC|nr:hypothetical protein CSUI_008156 [Cystoisospora suis]